MLTVPSSLAARFRGVEPGAVRSPARDRCRRQGRRVPRHVGGARAGARALEPSACRVGAAGARATASGAVGRAAARSARAAATSAGCSTADRWPDCGTTTSARAGGGRDQVLGRLDGRDRVLVADDDHDRAVERARSTSERSGRAAMARCDQAIPAGSCSSIHATTWSATSGRDRLRRLPEQGRHHASHRVDRPRRLAPRRRCAAGWRGPRECRPSTSCPRARARRRGPGAVPASASAT